MVWDGMGWDGIWDKKTLAHKKFNTFLQQTPVTLFIMLKTFTNNTFEEQCPGTIQ
jgi:hypothetical protein